MKLKVWMTLGVLVLGIALLAMGCDGSGGSGCGSEEPPIPYISGAGIGVSDLDRSVDFYSTVLELECAGRHRSKLDRIVEEVILTDRDGQKIFIMDFGPDENYTRRPGKLVFAVADAQTFYDRALANGATTLAPPTPILGTMVALVRDPDGYIVEMMSIATATRPLLVAVGIGASDLAASRAFYENVIGLQFDSAMSVPRLMEEEVLASPREMGINLVIMDYEADMDYADVPAKIVLSVDDARAFANVIADDDPANILLKPRAGRAGYARDIEGTLMEIVQEQEQSQIPE